MQRGSGCIQPEQELFEPRPDRGAWCERNGLFEFTPRHPRRAQRCPQLGASEVDRQRIRRKDELVVGKFQRRFVVTAQLGEGPQIVQHALDDVDGCRNLEGISLGSAGPGQPCSAPRAVYRLHDEWIEQTAVQ